ncbi:MAG: N-acetylmuramoyl-L-alanine amidase-like domain-containing protein, partial [Gemmatimonadota bacterium]
GPRRFVPQDRIADVADGIRTGDVIAATSTVEGLDIAHTGIAVWIDGRLHMIHAPLVGNSVQISEVPLADRIRSIASQDGIMVARWAER